VSKPRVDKDSGVTLGDLVRERRRAAGLTLEEVAVVVGCTSSHLSLVERGKRQMDEAGVVRLATPLGIEPSVALLASLRSRLPEELRHLVSTPGRASDSGAVHQVVRGLQAEHHEFSVEEIEFSGCVDWDGNARVTRHYRGVRPNAAGRPVWEISFRDRRVGKSPASDGYAKFAVEEEPASLDYELESETQGEWAVNRLVFPTGWRAGLARSSDRFSFTTESFVPRVFCLDPSAEPKAPPARTLRSPFLGAFTFHIPYLARTLTVNFAFPVGYAPAKWSEPWAWSGTTPFIEVARNLAQDGVARSITMTAERHLGELRAEEPLVGYSFALVWTPADRQRYLEARHGGQGE